MVGKVASLEADGAGRGRAVTRLALNGKPAFLIGEDLAVRTCHRGFRRLSPRCCCTLCCALDLE